MKESTIGIALSAMERYAGASAKNFKTIVEEFNCSALSHEYMLGIAERIERNLRDFNAIINAYEEMMNEPATTDPSFTKLKEFAEAAISQFNDEGGLIPEFAEDFTKEWLKRNGEE